MANFTKIMGTDNKNMRNPYTNWVRQRASEAPVPEVRSNFTRKNEERSKTPVHSKPSHKKTKSINKTDLILYDRTKSTLPNQNDAHTQPIGLKTPVLEGRRNQAQRHQGANREGAEREQAPPKQEFEKIVREIR